MRMTIERRIDFSVLRIDVRLERWPDATKFHDGQAFASCRDAKLTVAVETSPGKFEI